MKCPNCNKEINAEDNVCPNCNINLSFTTIESQGDIGKVVGTVNNVRRIFVISGICAVLLLLIVLPILLNSVFLLSGKLYFNGFIKTILIILISLIAIGVILLIICIINLNKKNRVLLFKRLLVVSLTLILIPIMIMSIVKVKGNMSLRDYSKVEYISLGSEKIPTLYSTVGYKEIIMSDEKNNEYDSDINKNYDSVLILYVNLTSSEINIYKQELIKNEFEKRKLLTDDEEVELYLKDSIKDNCFYSVSIDGFSIIYSKIDGEYEQVFGTLLK